ncbi:MAG: FAD-dependent oxidoreductase [Alphaproteobacteria bacterium]|nr:FAD-dependent oxidoreductase [Alphaproteobacteria bacterium]
MGTDTVAIIGAGIAGIACGRYLKDQGFDCTIIESHSNLGGQWERTNTNSGVWPRMRINTARFATRYSDIEFAEGVPMFPRNGEVLDMINAYVDKFDLRGLFEFETMVKLVEKDDGGGYVITTERHGETNTRHFDRVVVASGRFNKPDIPKIDGLDDFTGDCGVIHAFRYKKPETYLGKRILVLGGSISSLEIASDMAMMPTERVYLAQRRQRYVMPKMFAGVPLEYYAFTRAGGLAFREEDPEVLLAGAKEFLETMGGNPARYGAPAPHEDMAKAGITGSQHYLNLMAEDRIDARPWVQSVSGNTVTFTDGTKVDVDAIIIGTGFDLNLPYLSDGIARTVNLTRKSIDLSEFTFHPDLENLAFIGMYAQLGPYPVVLEQQARYIAYTWGGVIPAPSREALQAGVAECVEKGHHSDYRQQHEMAVHFAKLFGGDPADVGDAELQEIIDNSAVVGEMFRITGPDALPGAADYMRSMFWKHGVPEIRAEIGARYGKTATGEPIGG